MNPETSLIAQQTRLSECDEQIKECQNRPQGMKVDEWCQQHGIKKASYYWRLRKVREAFLEAIDTVPTFVEMPAMLPKKPTTSSEHKIVAVLRGKNQLTMEITD